MIWAVVIIGGILVFAAIASQSKKAGEAQEKAELNELSKSRVDAYQDYLRRTSDNAEIKAMTDNELKDYLSSTMRDYTKGIKDASSTYQGVFWIALFVCVVAFSATELWGFLFPPLAVGKWAYDQHKKAVKKLEAEIAGKGLELSRLKIEQ